MTAPASISPRTPGKPSSAGRLYWPRLFGYDFFISFKLGTPPDGAQSYASDLARRLREQYFTVFFSEEEAAPGEKLDLTLRKALRRSRALVVVANDGALFKSLWVRREVEEFRRQGPKRPLIFINVGGAIARYVATPEAGSWLGHEDRIWLEESEEAVRTGLASDELLRRLVVTPRFVKGNARLRWALGSVTGTLAALTVLAAYSAFEAIQQRDSAQSRELAALSAIRLDSDRESSLGLAIAAAERKPTVQAERTLRRALFKFDVLATLVAPRKGGRTRSRGRKIAVKNNA